MLTRPNGTSVSVRGTATAPAANAAIATLASANLSKGTYEVCVVARYGGTADVIDNMDLRVGGVVVLVLPVLPIVNGTPIPLCLTITVDGTQTITVNAVATGGAGSIFVAHLIAKKIFD